METVFCETNICKQSPQSNLYERDTRPTVLVSMAESAGSGIPSVRIVVPTEIREHFAGKENVLPSWKNLVQPSGKYGLFAPTIAEEERKWAYSPPDLKRMIDWDRSAGLPEVTKETRSDSTLLNRFGEAYCALLADRHSDLGPALRLPFTLFVSPLVLDHASRIVTRETMSNSTLAKTALAQFMNDHSALTRILTRCMTGCGPSSEIVDANQYDLIIFLQRLPNSGEYMLSVFNIDRFSEKQTAVHVFYYSAASEVGTVDAEVRHTFYNQLEFLSMIARTATVYSSKPHREPTDIQQITEIEWIKMKTTEPEFLRMKRFDVDNERSTSSQRLCKLMLLAQVISQTHYYDDRRFLRLDVLERMSYKDMESEVCINMLLARVRDSDFMRKVVFLPELSGELEQYTRVTAPVILHPVEQWEMANLFSMPENKIVVSRMMRSASKQAVTRWHKELNTTLNPCISPQEAEEAAKGSRKKTKRKSKRKGKGAEGEDDIDTVSSATPAIGDINANKAAGEKSLKKRTERTSHPIPHEAPSASTNSAKRVQNASEQLYYQVIAPYFAAHSYEDVSGKIIPSKQAYVDDSKTMYKSGGWACAYPLFRRLPPRGRLFSFGDVRFIKETNALAWSAELEQHVETHKALLTEKQRAALSTLSRYFNDVARRVVGKGIDHSMARKALKKMRSEYGSLMEQLVQSTKNGREKSGSEFARVYHKAAKQKDPNPFRALLFYAVLMRLDVSQGEFKLAVSRRGTKSTGKTNMSKADMTTALSQTLFGSDEKAKDVRDSMSEERKKEIDNAASIAKQHFDPEAGHRLQVLAKEIENLMDKEGNYTMRELKDMWEKEPKQFKKLAELVWNTRSAWPLMTHSSKISTGNDEPSTEGAEIAATVSVVVEEYDWTEENIREDRKAQVLDHLMELGGVDAVDKFMTAMEDVERTISDGERMIILSANEIGDAMYGLGIVLLNPSKKEGSLLFFWTQDEDDRPIFEAFVQKLNFAKESDLKLEYDEIGESGLRTAEEEEEEEEETEVEVVEIETQAQISARKREKEKHAPGSKALFEYGAASSRLHTISIPRLENEEVEVSLAQYRRLLYENAVSRAKSVAFLSERLKMRERYLRFFIYADYDQSLYRRYPLLRSWLARYTTLWIKSEWETADLDEFERLYGNRGVVEDIVIHNTPLERLTPPERALIEIRSEIRDIEASFGEELDIKSGKTEEQIDSISIGKDYLMLEWNVVSALNSAAWSILEQINHWNLEVGNTDRNMLTQSLQRLVEALLDDLEDVETFLNHDSIRVERPTQRHEELEELANTHLRISRNIMRVDEGILCVYIDGCPAPPPSEYVFVSLPQIARTLYGSIWLKELARLVTGQPGLRQPSLTSTLGLTSIGADTKFNYHSNDDGTALVFVQSLNIFGTGDGVGTHILLERLVESDLLSLHLSNYYESRSGIPEAPPKIIAEELRRRESAIISRLEQEHDAGETHNALWQTESVGYFAALIMPDALHWVSKGEVVAMTVRRDSLSKLATGELSEDERTRYKQFVDTLLQSHYMSGERFDQLQRGIDSLASKSDSTPGTLRLIGLIHRAANETADKIIKARKEDPNSTAVANLEYIERKLTHAAKMLADRESLQRHKLEHGSQIRSLETSIEKMKEREELLREIHNSASDDEFIDKLELPATASPSAKRLLEVLKTQQREGIGAAAYSRTLLSHELEVLLEKIRGEEAILDQKKKELLSYEAVSEDIRRYIETGLRTDLLDTDIAEAVKSMETAAMISRGTQINMGHGLVDPYEADEYSDWVLLNSGGHEQKALPSSLFNVNDTELVCGIGRQTSSFGDLYLKRPDLALGEWEFKKAARAAIELKRVAPRDPESEMPEGLTVEEDRKNKENELLIESWLTYDDARARFPIVRDTPNTGSYDWRDGDEAIIIASGHFWEHVTEDEVANITMFQIYGKNMFEVDAERVVRKLSDVAQSIEDKLMEQYLKNYKAFTDGKTYELHPERIPKVSIKAILFPPLEKKHQIAYNSIIGHGADNFRNMPHARSPIHWVHPPLAQRRGRSVRASSRPSEEKNKNSV